MDRADDHRRPPRPPHEHAEDGLCRLCGRAVLEGKRRRWHKRCLSLWLVASVPAYARAFVFARDHGRCAQCSEQDDRLDGTWQVDHRYRLADCPRILAFWLPSNIQTLCRCCHAVKTARENAHARAHERTVT